jgi:hypothetical protein
MCSQAGHCILNTPGLKADPAVAGLVLNKMYRALLVSGD